MKGQNEELAAQASRVREPQADAAVELSGPALSVLKQEVNRIVWTYGPGAMTLAEADKLACEIVDRFHAAFSRVPAAAAAAAKAIDDGD